jgi:molybdate transport system substrate-binding protein
MKHTTRLAATTLLLMMNSFSASAETIQLYAAGSLKAALTEVANAYEKQYQTSVSPTFGPSGLLRKAIEKGEQPDVFASANMAHPTALAKQGWGSPVALFARNQLCALAQPNLAVTTDTLLTTLLNDKISVGTSTPKADPSGDYAWKLFEKAEQVTAGNFTILSNKALQLTGGPTSEKAPEGQNQYGWVMAEKKADIFLTYCTNAVLAKKHMPKLTIIHIPDELAVGADYGLLVRSDAPTKAWQLAMYILSPQGQTILKNYGFEAPAIPHIK